MSLSSTVFLKAGLRVGIQPSRHPSSPLDLPLGTGGEFGRSLAGNLGLLLLGLRLVPLLLRRYRLSLLDIRAAPACTGTVVWPLDLAGHPGPVARRWKRSREGNREVPILRNPPLIHPPHHNPSSLVLLSYASHPVSFMWLENLSSYCQCLNTFPKKLKVKQTLN